MVAKKRQPRAAQVKAIESLKGRHVQSILLALLSLAAIYWLAWVTGATFACQGLSLDTCWLIRLGEIISTTGDIPRVDPYTFILPALTSASKPFVLYQWLSEVVFYKIYHYFQAKGLLIFSAWITALTFLTIPLRSSMRVNFPPVWSVAFVSLSALSAYFRCLVRPEIFTCLFLVLWLVLLRALREEREVSAASATDNGINWRALVFLTASSIVWCNMHSGFVSGLILLAIYALGFFLQDHMRGEPLSSETKTIWFAWPACALVTLFNPYGVGLWQYLPYLFFAPVNDFIDELRPLNWQDLAVMHPFLLCFLVLVYAGITFYIWQNRSSPALFSSPLKLMSVAIIVFATGLCILRRRLISISVLLMLFESMNFMVRRVPDQWPRKLWNMKISYVVLELLVFGFAWRGVVDIVASGVPIVIPQFTRRLVPPLKALEFFRTNYKGGRIFSSADISDMVEFYIKPKSALFVDTRFDAYPTDILRREELILNAIDNWRELIDSYKFDWIFVRCNAVLGRKLEADPAWMTVYKDSQCKILRRKRALTTG